MKPKGNPGITLCVLLLAIGLVGCETTTGLSDADIRQQQRQAMRSAIRDEPPGDYFVGRRFYKYEYKMWGWVRKPGQPWSAAQLVMLNEQQKIAPDRAANDLGYDNDYEYRLTGYFSGDEVYEPASNRFYPEFVLTGYELRSQDPPLIYEEERQTQPNVRLLKPPI